MVLTSSPTPLPPAMATPGRAPVSIDTMLPPVASIRTLERAALQRTLRRLSRRATVDVTPRGAFPSSRSGSKRRPEGAPTAATTSRAPSKSVCFPTSELVMMEAEQPEIAQLPSVQAPTARPITDFDICMACARKHRVKVGEVKKCYDEFVRLDVNKDGILNPDEFEVVVRKFCGIDGDEPTPSHLFERQWGLLDPLGRGHVVFDDFFAWFRNVAFCDDISSKGEIDVAIRRLVKQYGFNVLDLERVRSVFSRYADGGSAGCIDKSKFKQVLCCVVGLPMDADVPEDTLKRYYREIDVNGDGEVDFEEFARWYLSVHSSDG